MDTLSTKKATFGIDQAKLADALGVSTDHLSDSEFANDIAAVGRISAVPRILEVICRTTGMGFAAVARVTDHRWVCCAVRDEIQFGLGPGDELELETTICEEIRRDRKAVAIDDVSSHEVYNSHQTPTLYGFQSYVSVPIIRSDGTLFGTLCAIDPQPASVNASATVGMFKLFAELIASHFDTSEQLAAREADLLGERSASEIREQFIAVLGHDLRNPLAAIDAGTRILRKGKLNEEAAEILGLMHGSVLRMSGLIDNVLDFARGRLGGGIPIARSSDEPIEPVLKQVVGELRAKWPERVIDVHFEMEDPFDCDRGRLAQLFSNLLGNALAYGAATDPVRVFARTDGASFELSVANAGAAIPPASMGRLFQPFARGAVKSDQQGLGLGLYIASEIAKAHGGTLVAESNDIETKFTFRMQRSARRDDTQLFETG